MRPEINMHAFHLSVPISTNVMKKWPQETQRDNVRIKRILSQLATDTRLFVSSKRNAN